MITTSSIQPKESRQRLGLEQVGEIPPERGARQLGDRERPAQGMTAQTQHSRIDRRGWPATVAGTRKMPLPMATPTDTATVCSSPTERGMRSPHWSAIRESFRKQLDPMTHRDGGATADVVQASDVRRGDDIRAAGLQRTHLGAQQLLRELRLQH